MTKAESQAREYAREALGGYHPMVRDFIMGTGCFSEDEQVKMNLRVAGKIAQKASKAIMDRFEEVFSDPSGNRVVELALPKGMPHPWSSDPDRDAKVRMAEDGRSKPFRTLAECIESECPKVEPVDAHLAACRERDRADEARAVWRKRWQERGKTIAHLQARLSERKSGGVNATLQSWCRVVESQRTAAVSQARAYRKEVDELLSMVSTYEDRIAELTKANKQLDEGYNAAVLAVSEATNKRLEAERRAHFAEAAERSVPVSKTGDRRSGLRTEQVVLELTYDTGRTYHLPYCDLLRTRLWPNESVRVVTDDEPTSAWIDLWKKRHQNCVAELKKADADVVNLRAERDAAKARVEELEAEAVRESNR
jgi:hypothetical protein